MKSIIRRTNKVLSAVISERRIYVQSGKSTSYMRITPLSQLMIGVAAVSMAGWISISTSLVVQDRVAAKANVDQTIVMRKSYESRLEELARERDTRAGEARSAQGRFQVAMDQISRQQSTILESVEEQRELSLALELVQDRLSDAVQQRDEIAKTNDHLVKRMSDVSDTLTDANGSGTSNEELLHTISVALSDAAAARDLANDKRAELEQQLSELELRELINSRRQDEMIEQLEQAVAMSFGPLEKLFLQSDIDVDEVLASVRRNHTGAGGGPLAPATQSSRSFDNSTLGSRLDSVMVDLDRVNLLRIAAGKIPYAMPVTTSHRFTSGYGYRRDPKGGGRRMHRGIDLASSRGTPIYATADGIVRSAKRESGYGNTVRIEHEFGFETIYAHQSKLNVKAGQRVSRGDQIGAMGTTGRSTGVHLHYEVHLNGRPVNPMTYVEAAKDVF